MDAGGKKPYGVDENSFKYIGKNKSEKIESTTADSEIEALAVYPETRVRGRDVKSEDPKNQYQDFNDIHKPFGSSGKEYAYAIAAILKEKIPTTYNEESIDAKQTIIDALEFYGRKNPEATTYNPERNFLGVLANEMIRTAGEKKLEIATKIKSLYGFSDELIEQLSNAKDENRLLEIAKDSPEIQKVIAGMPEKINYHDASEKYKKIMNFGK